MLNAKAVLRIATALAALTVLFYLTSLASLGAQQVEPNAISDANDLRLGSVVQQGTPRGQDGICTYDAHLIRMRPATNTRQLLVLRNTASCQLVVIDKRTVSLDPDRSTERFGRQNPFAEIFGGIAALERPESSYAELVTISTSGTPATWRQWSLPDYRVASPCTAMVLGCPDSMTC